ncbi:MAG: hypothetical protein MJE63_22245 [Proteobacteria bacterium]|nr:hypothetical protein [Pseudomonadota bacterium]
MKNADENPSIPITLTSYDWEQVFMMLFDQLRIMTEKCKNKEPSGEEIGLYLNFTDHIFNLVLQHAEHGYLHRPAWFAEVLFQDEFIEVVELYREEIEEFDFVDSVNSVLERMGQFYELAADIQESD